MSLDQCIFMSIVAESMNLLITITFDQLIKQQLPLSTPSFPLSIDLGRDLKLAACRLWRTDSSQLRVHGALRGVHLSDMKAGARVRSIHKM